MKRTTISLPDELAMVLQREARRRDTSISDIAREALAAHLGVDGGRRPEFGFVGLGRSGFTDTSERFDEYFGQEWERDHSR